MLTGVTAKMRQKKMVFLGRENARKTHKKGLAKEWSFIDNCLIIMGLHRFLMSPSHCFFMQKFSYE
jgi:hypothetical protein